MVKYRMKLLNQKQLNELLVVGNSPEYGTMNKHGGSEGAESRRTYIKRITKGIILLIGGLLVNATHETFYQIINDISSGNCQGILSSIRVGMGIETPWCRAYGWILSSISTTGLVGILFLTYGAINLYRSGLENASETYKKIEDAVDAAYGTTSRVMGWDQVQVLEDREPSVDGGGKKGSKKSRSKSKKSRSKSKKSRSKSKKRKTSKKTRRKKR
tara:strand:+ start:4178 stop:4822 length:645 start_codon:yes stop_codon:yes gene_type:complete